MVWSRFISIHYSLPVLHLPLESHYKMPKKFAHQKIILIYLPVWSSNANSLTLLPNRRVDIYNEKSGRWYHFIVYLSLKKCPCLFTIQKIENNSWRNVQAKPQISYLLIHFFLLAVVYCPANVESFLWSRNHEIIRSVVYIVAYMPS